MDLTRLLLGFALVSVGTSSGVLAVAYWRRSGPTLLSFGVFAFLYGARLMLAAGLVATALPVTPRQLTFAVWLIYYCLPIAGTIFAERITPRSQQALRSLWRAWIPLAIGLVAYDLATGGPALRLYLVAVVATMVVLLVQVVGGVPARTVDRRIQRAGAAALFVFVINDNLVGLGLTPWTVSLEPIGISVFILALGLVTARQFFKAERDLATVAYEMRTARSIQTSILPTAVPQIAGLDVAVRYLPVGAVAGDLYDFHATASHQLGLLIADVTGHGVPAALIASMVKMAFVSQRDFAVPSEVLAGMNRSLSGHVESRFVTASYLWLDTERAIARCSSAGHPPPLLWRRTTGEIVALDAPGLLMGFQSDASYRTSEHTLERGDRLLLYTDGVVEAQDPQGEFFGDDRLKAFLLEHGQYTAEPFLDALVRHLSRWRGHHATDALFDDDVTVLVADVR